LIIRFIGKDGNEIWKSALMDERTPELRSKLQCQTAEHRSRCLLLESAPDDDPDDPDKGFDGMVGRRLPVSSDSPNPYRTVNDELAAGE
jgi:hypothetical protein